MSFDSAEKDADERNDEEKFVVAPIDHLPEEILERIFSFTSQYKYVIHVMSKLNRLN